MKLAAVLCLVTGILAVSWSFAMRAPVALEISAEARAAMDRDAELAHMELDETDVEAQRAREAAQMRMTQQIEQAEAALRRYQQRQMQFRWGGCALAAIGIGLFFAARAGSDTAA